MDASPPLSPEPTEPPRWQVCLLGEFRVARADQIVPPTVWRRRKAASLVKLLALAPGHALHREQLFEALWPELGPAAAANNLRQTLHSLREALAIASPAPTRPADLIETRGDRFGLAEDCRVDVDAFEEAAAAAGRSRQLAAYRAAIDRYGGELLPEDRYEDWAAQRREVLRATYLGLLLDAARLADRGGEPTTAITYLQRAVRDDPAHEEAHVALMRLYAGQGQRQAALRQYRLLRDALRRELDSEPDPASQGLYTQILAGQLSPLRAATEVAERPPAAPSPPTVADGVASLMTGPARRAPSAGLTPLIGRDQELAELVALLPTTRLLTLVGSGGVGKTRLALAVGAALADAYADGQRVVLLASLADPAMLPSVVANVLGAREEPGRSLLDTLCDMVRRLRVLLVLDNCEHLIDACAALAETLLNASPHLRILATSRTALRVGGEVRWRVPSLAAPASEHLPPLAELERVAAVRLFVERARAVAPGFALTARNAAAVATICRRLDGLPLAIELAAARLALLTPEQLTARLDDALRLLTGGSRTAPTRQQTLRATLDWSHDLLTEDERRLLRRLAVFAGGFTLEAAEAVGAGEGLDRAEVLDLLARLVDHSLVLVEPGDEDEGHYRLLETVRQYAGERLAASGERATIRARHAAFYLARVRAARPIIWGSHAKRIWWLDELARVIDDLRAVRRWAVEVGAIDDLLWLAGTLPPVFLLRCTQGEGLDWIAAALALPGADRSPARAQAWLGQAYFDRSSEQFDQALTWLQASLPEFQRLGDDHGLGFAQLIIGTLHAWRGDAAQARPVLEAALALDQRLEPPLGAANILNLLGHAALFSGEPDEAHRRLVEAAAVAERAGDRSRWTHARLFGGLAALQLSDLPAAREHLAAALTATLSQQDDWGLAIALEGFAGLAVVAGQFEQALCLVGAAEAARAPDNIKISIVAYYDFRADLLRPAYAALAPSAQAAALAAGRALNREAAGALALATSPPLSPVAPTTSPASLPTRSAGDGPPLTRREREVAELIAQGRTNAQIAASLGMAPRTADTHVSAILHKLGVASRAEVAAWLSARG